MLPVELGDKITEKNILFSASVELTYRCNQKCVHCYQQGLSAAENELSASKVKGILKQLADSGCLFLSLTGGEPLLRPDFWEIAEFAKKNNFALTLQTNGTLINKAQAKRIKELNFIQVHISLLGAKAKTHDAITGLAGSFEKSINAARLLRDKGLTVFLKATLLKENAAELEDMDLLAKSLGALTIFSPIVYPCTNCSSLPLTHRAGDKEIKRIFKFLTRKHKNDTLLPRAQEDDAPLCLAAKSDCSVDPQGNLYPCVGLPFLLGDLKKDSFKQIWQNSENADIFRKLKIKDWQECRGCELADICVRCPGLGYLEHGSLKIPSKETCRLTKILKEVLDEQEEEKIREA